MYDIIGDIHGHADKLEQLLQNLGYENSKGYYSHPDRKVIFVGDYIDRGFEIRKTLEIVKAMVEDSQAIALMGNHEFNAILFNTQDKNGDYLRERTAKNLAQHSQTLDQFQDNIEAYNSYIEWFKTLPLFYENEHFRVVHACWDEAQIQFLQETLQHARLSDQLLQDHYQKGSQLYEAIEITLKGKELKMPEGLTFKDKDGHERSDLRIKWWLNPESITYKEYSVEDYSSLSDLPIPANLVQQNKPYSAAMKPVFFGHYWLDGDSEVSVYGNNVCCVDYSVAKEGKLVAYRWNGEDCLLSEKMHHV